MKSLRHWMMIGAILVLVLLTATTASAQSSTQLELPKVGEPGIISIGYSNDGRGRVRAADSKGKVQQYLEVWENQSKMPNVVTYMLVGGDGRTFSATWGRGPVNPAAFNCKAENVPEFGEKSLWVATVTDGVLKFQEIDNEDIKGLFSNLAKARRDWGREVNSANQRYAANTTEQNLLTFLKEKNRKKWLEQGWLQPATTCVQHF